MTTGAGRGSWQQPAGSVACASAAVHTSPLSSSRSSADPGRPTGTEWWRSDHPGDLRRALGDRWGRSSRARPVATRGRGPRASPETARRRARETPQRDRGTGRKEGRRKAADCGRWRPGGRPGAHTGAVHKKRVPPHWEVGAGPATPSHWEAGTRPRQEHRRRPARAGSSWAATLSAAWSAFVEGPPGPRLLQAQSTSRRATRHPGR